MEVRPSVILVMADTPRYGHQPITMHRCGPDFHQGKPVLGTIDRKFKQVGDFYWKFDEQGRRSLIVALPFNRTDGRLNFAGSSWTIDHKNFCEAQWSWDDNEDQPTLSPSLHWIGVWHGWVRAGMLVEA